jgi:type VI secretion system protein ImpM
VATVTAPADLRDAPGWYGKIAALGDFAHRRVSAEWVRACDGWLSVALQGARERLGARWLDVYLTAPVLRFAWSPGVVDPQWWFGLLMPSCDNVGRYFPLLIAQARAQPPQDRIALDHLERWYEHLAQAAMHTLADTTGAVDTLEAALHEVPPWPTPGRSWNVATEAGPVSARHRLGRAAPLSHWIQALAARELAERVVGCSLWWRLTEGGSGDSMDIVRGLPDGAALADLLAGTRDAAR